ncbi:MAG TPA: family 16 glycoside hydrolase [Acidimicrobiales bacterium]|nr:family 16 glycoside hydrolase [Acidimicrobiales bacterium]
MLLLSALVLVSGMADGADAATRRRRKGTRRVTATVTMAKAKPAPAPAPSSLLLAEDFERIPEGTWFDGGTYGQWRSVYNGYGRNAIEQDGPRGRVLTLSPLASSQPAETHGALAVSTTRISGDIDLTATMQTVQQLRTPAPNAWEVPWLLWNHSDDTHFYYVVLKPNGVELGKEDPAYPGAQRFLATSATPGFAVGAWHTVRVVQRGTTITVWGNGQQLLQFTDTERPYTAGSVGLYSEDATVRFGDVRAVRPA